MNRCVMIIFLAAATAAAKDQDLGKQAAALAEANLAKDVLRIKSLARSVTASKNDRAGELEDQMAAELSKSLPICKKDNDALEVVITALGKLRSKKGVPALKRIAFRKKAKSAREASLQARALVALGAVADPKQLGGIEDQTKNRDDTVARGAYASLEFYSGQKGKIRKRVAEILMKRLGAEYPRYSPTAGKRVSPEKRKRWGKVSASLIGSLQAVCHQPTLAAVGDWEEWWKENKKRAKTWRDAKN